ncbi:DUF1127 domain-containing protein [Pseudoponticoccus marisrubri]|uniref:DUF1127 domain-containing protein n=1 Tax=Pseudoponticoccus marisrubri TaxID=1685382 RepID=UPI0012FE4927|nr:DUF1127 domain-containing protein [Pseudoponticoccus marisrubri]
MSFLTRFTDPKRANYRRTVRELRDLPPAVARDLGVTPENAEALARKAVYGI